MWPVRCFSCNKVIGAYELQYERLIKSGVSKKDALDSFNLKRYCCRSIILGSIDKTDDYLKLNNNIIEQSEKSEKNNISNHLERSLKIE